jgi:hypothetical protein
MDSLSKHFDDNLKRYLEETAADSDVSGFKSIICYRTGLDISTVYEDEELKLGLLNLFQMLKNTGSLRLGEKAVNDHVVRRCLEVAAKYKKPGRLMSQFPILLTKNTSAISYWPW